jgi:hypothetical protein
MNALIDNKFTDKGFYFSDKLVFGFDIMFGGLEDIITFGLLLGLGQAIVHYYGFKFLNNTVSCFHGVLQDAIFTMHCYTDLDVV